MAKHECRNRYAGEGANGGCFFEIEPAGDQMAWLDVGYSCTIVHRDKIPVTWLAEIITIAVDHEGGISGFLKHHKGADSYALMCDPAPDKTSP